jgi:hypothetical protein
MATPPAATQAAKPAPNATTQHVNPRLTLIYQSSHTIDFSLPSLSPCVCVRVRVCVRACMARSRGQVDGQISLCMFQEGWWSSLI